MQPILGRTWLEWIRLSRIFRAPFANLSLEIVKKMSRYYLLSGLSRIFRKPFANVYISRKVPFAQTFQIYACGPRWYKAFHGFLHDSHIHMCFNCSHLGHVRVGQRVCPCESSVSAVLKLPWRATTLQIFSLNTCDHAGKSKITSGKTGCCRSHIPQPHPGCESAGSKWHF